MSRLPTQKTTQNDSTQALTLKEKIYFNSFTCKSFEFTLIKICTDLARDLANDILTLMSSTKPYIRKKAVLLMYKVFLNFPDALRPAFPKLKEKLEVS